ncbi:unnamed protein product, partial [Didymodactylos carnosus]
GYLGSILNTAELYDPLTRAWTTTARMTSGRLYHTASVIINGKVLVAGGEYLGFGLHSAELYDSS